MKICPVGADLFHADRQTDMAKLIVAFRNFAKAPKKLPQQRERADPTVLLQQAAWRQAAPSVAQKEEA